MFIPFIGSQVNYHATNSHRKKKNACLSAYRSVSAPTDNRAEASEFTDAQPAADAAPLAAKPKPKPARLLPSPPKGEAHAKFRYSRHDWDGRFNEQIGMSTKNVWFRR
jgi:hypothetical protein